MTLKPAGRRSHRRGASGSRSSAILVVAALVVANYFLFFHETDEGEPPPPIEERLKSPSPHSAPAAPLDAPKAKRGVPADKTVEPGASQPADAPASPSPLPEPAPIKQELDDFGEPIGRKVAGKLKRGQTVITALKSEGIDNRTALPIIRAMEGVFDFRQAKVGNKFEAWVDDEGQVLRFAYISSPLDVFEVALQRDGSYQAKKKKVPTRVEIARIGCAIRSSLYESVRRCGEGMSLGSVIIDLFAWDVDFFQDVRQGDEFRVIIEKISVDGRFLKYGRVLAAEYRGKFGRHRLVQYQAPDGRAGFFTPEGRAVRKDFLKSPLKYTTASAGGANGIRASLKKAGPVVYTAKRGTPVWAISSGTVIHAGASGSLGRTVTIKHDNGFTSTYGHLGKVSRGLKVGTLVTQKTVIGMVGRSGEAEDPQLVFMLRKKNKLVNPFRMQATEADPISSEHRSHFEKETRGLLEELESTPVIGILEKRS